jgi:hypothetical protein
MGRLLFIKAQLVVVIGTLILLEDVIKFSKSPYVAFSCIIMNLNPKNIQLN